MKRSSLNHCFRLVWSEAQGAWVPVPETARGHGKTGRCALGLLATALLAPAFALASPSGGVVTSGAATINQSGAVTNVDQSTQKAAINWQGFSVGSGETVNFNQPNASAVTLNRVVGNETSVIAGALNATGQVFIVNSNGVLFGKGSSVDVGGLVASTRSISDADFNAGNFIFQGSGSGSVTNLGTLTARDGGYIALLGNSVSNQGVISATKGTVALAAGNKITLNFNGDSLLNVTLDEGALNALVENKQAIYADGGTVLLTAQAANELLGAQVNNSGLIRARTLDDLKGSITLYAHGGSTSVDGTLDASAPTAGDGGAIETSGTTVNVADTASISTLASAGKSGTWLIDPTDFTIAASGGDMTGKLLSALLASGSITISSSAGTNGTSGNVNVNDAVSWNSPSTLTLTAATDININSPVTAQYSAWSATAPAVKAGLTLNAGHDVNINNAVSLTNAALVMTYGDDYNIRTTASYSGAVLNASGLPVANTDTSGGTYGSITFNGGLGSGDALTINSHPYTLVYSMTQFDALGGLDPNNQDNDQFNNVTGYYAIAQNLNAGGVTYEYSPIYFFGGTLAGLGHKISNLTMNNPQYDTGLIADNNDCGCGSITIRDLGLVNIDFTNVSTGNIGAFLGEGYGTFKDLYSTGTISGSFIDVAGGLAGSLSNSTLTPSTITSSYSSVNISSTGVLGETGGLVGTINGSIRNSDAIGNITAVSSTVGSNMSEIGGLVGSIFGTVTNSYATGTVSATISPTAIAAWVAQGYAAPDGSQSEYIGGLAGRYGAYSQTDNLSNSFATGSVTGGIYLGGLVGQAMSNGAVAPYAFLNINNDYATGNVTSIYLTAGYGAYVGGLIGQTSSTSTSTSPSGLLTGTTSISNVFATGNVSSKGNDGVGGLIGDAETKSTTSTITNAYATGNVSGGTSGYDVGGLIGEASQFSISSVYATGNVSSGLSGVGGLIGLAYYSTVSNSYETGAVTSSYSGSNANVGGLIGFANNSSTSNTYYNSDVNSMGIGAAWTGGGTGQGGHSVTLTGYTGLSGTQMGDVPYYLNGTINQVVADRTAANAAAAAAAAAAQTAANAATAAAAQAALNAAGQPGSSAAAQAAAAAQTAATAATAAAALAAQTAAQGSSLAAIQAATTAAQTAATNAANAAAAAQSALSGATTAVSNAEAAAAAAAAAAQAAAAAAAAQAAAEAAAKAAAAAAAKERAFEQGAVATADAQVASPLGAPKPPETAGPSPRTPAQALDQNIVFTASKYSADIRSIEVNGQVLQLQDEKEKKTK